MARKKSAEETVIGADEISGMPIVSTSEDAPSVIVEANTKEKKTKTASEQTIPENIKGTLKVFCKYPELLVTHNGGAFLPGTKLPKNVDAILYKNPFYNS